MARTLRKNRRRTAITKRRRGTRKQNIIANAIALPVIATGSLLFGTETGRYYARRAYLRATHGYGRVSKRSYTRSRAYRGQRTQAFEE